jgi:prepilin peptidase CpaA
MSATVLTLVLLAKLAVATAMIVAAGVDISRRIIPNETVLVVAIAGLLIRLLSPSESNAWLSIVAALAILVALGLLGGRGFLGGGDVKMISAASLAVPLHDVLSLLLYIALAGGVVSLFYLGRALVVAARSRPAEGGEAAVLRSVDLSASLPYGVAILLGMAALHIGKAIQCSAADFCWL